MAAIETDGTTSPRPHLVSTAGTHLVGTITASYDEIVEMFGDPDTVPEVEPMWGIMIYRDLTRHDSNQIAALYPRDFLNDPRASPCRDVIWGIGGHDQGVVDAIGNALARYRAAA
ncbi:hypothetical protein AB0395_34800 [Streptosporangium sp. NPDC051023]|uniref:hypothetical protein n=1 Tax=Streptosporangium sp. NPDC051023 TaxID=3155410 RepID=UPI00344B34BA